MKQKKVILSMMTAACIVAMLGGCGQNQTTGNRGDSAMNQNVRDSVVEQDNNASAMTEERTDDTTQAQFTELTVRFGDSGQPFTMHLLDNATAQAIANYVGTSDWRLPIYDRDDTLDYSVMEYYDIPSRYDIPSDNPQTITETKAGDVYYSDPNRIVLFYQDAEISEENTKIGTFDATDDFISAVENNPVLEGWGNKIIQISRP